MPVATASSSLAPIVLAIGTILCLFGTAAGLPLAGASATMAACGAILVIGLPHGTLDLELFRQDQPGAPRPLVLGLYLGFAGVMAVAWFASPIAALALFYALAVAHFGEDWSRTGSEFLARGMALAMLVLPALTHPFELTELFAALVGTDASAVFVDLLRLVAPVATLVAMVAMGLLWSTGARAEALGGGTGLVAMTLLPPVVGFALFFCLSHSPRHLRDGLAALSTHSTRGQGTVILLLTLAASGIAAIVYGLSGSLPVSERLAAASFMTLSILTLPHMAVPMALRALAYGQPHGERAYDADDPKPLVSAKSLD